MKIQKLKTELDRRYKLIAKTPEIKIDYDYFCLIADYVDWIEINKTLKNTLYSNKAFKKYKPEALLLGKGWEIANIERFYKNNKGDKLLIAYLNLLAVCYAVHDLETSLKRKKTDMKLYYREKAVEHLKKIKSGQKIIGYGHFWFNKDKYRKWIKIVHQKLLSDLAFLDVYKKEEKQRKQKTKTSQGTITYEYDKINETGFLRIGENTITFEKDRALIIYYFFELKDIEDGYKTYRDFNKKMSRDVKSPFFRQSIERINLRITKENNFVKSIISQKAKGNPHEVNRYKWKIES